MSCYPVLKGPRFRLSLGERGYPTLLAQTADPPKALYGIGDPASLSACLAIVGARKATPYGLACARMFSRVVAERGITVASGGAIGCDQEAQRSALDAGGTVVSVAGTGADLCYPRGSAGLMARIVESGGAVISELAWGYEPRRHTFVRRNRIIAGVSCATLIVEAGLPSGTFSTADAALSDGRDVLVVPGSIFSPESMGSNRLLVQGAQPVTDERTFCDALGHAFGTLVPSCAEGASTGVPDLGLGSQERTVLHAVTANPMRPDSLARELRLDIGEIMCALSGLELDGLVERYRDGRYGLSARARAATSGGGPGDAA